MTIAIDVGCARYGGDFSIERLIEEFDPELLFGFDPSDGVDMYLDDDKSGQFKVGDTEVVIEKAAAWVFDGEIGFRQNGLGSEIAADPRLPQVRCIDLARFILEVPAGHDIILKMDCEGSEYELLEHLIERGADKRLKLGWIEWHGSQMERRGQIEQDIGCEMVEWRW